MKNKNVSLFLLMVCFVIGIMFLASADSDSLTAQTTGANDDPTVDTCDASVVANRTVNPTEGSTTNVVVSMNVTDTNGVDDLNNSLAKVEFDDNATNFVALFESASNTTCTSSDVNTTTREYTCTVQMEYWYQHSENYSIQCSGGDKNDTALVTKDAVNSDNFDYTKLVASTVDSTTVDFGTITSSQYSTIVNDTNAPAIINNTGNAALTTISVTGANLTQTGKVDIDIGQFFADDLASFNATVAQKLTTSKLQITSVSVSIEDATPGGTTDNVSFYFNVTSTLEPGSFSGTWTLFEEE